MTAADPPAGKKSTAKQTTAKTSTAKKTTAKASTAKKTTAKTSTAKKPPQGAGPMVDGDDVVRAAADIISVFEGQPDLFLAACANPVRAMLDAGIELSPSAQRYVALRCRFSPAEAEQLENLAKQIDEHLGAHGDVDLDDDAAVAAALRQVGIDVGVDVDVDPTVGFDAVDIGQQRRPVPPPRKRGDVHPNRRSVLAAAETLDQVHRWREVKRVGPDPFEAYAGKHPAIGPLLAYRKQSATQPRFATEEVYDRLARTTNGQLSDGVNITLRVRLNNPSATGGG